MSLKDSVVARQGSAAVLNLWGENLSDLSCLETSPHTPRLRTVCLSLNQLSSLQSLKRASQLEELFVRGNNIANITDLHLEAFPNLKHIWLENNPICRNPLLRNHILKMCPQLETLDGIAITDIKRSPPRKSASRSKHRSNNRPHSHQKQREQPLPSIRGHKQALTPVVTKAAAVVVPPKKRNSNSNSNSSKNNKKTEVVAKQQSKQSHPKRLPPKRQHATPIVLRHDASKDQGNQRVSIPLTHSTATPNQHRAFVAVSALLPSLSEPQLLKVHESITKLL